MSGTGERGVVIRPEGWEVHVAASGGPGVDGGGGPPHDPGMDARGTRLEEESKEFHAELRMFRSEISALRSDVSKESAAVRKDIGGEISTLRGEVNTLRADVARLDGRVGQLPTTWVMLTGLIGSQFTLAALIFAARRLLGHG